MILHAQSLLSFFRNLIVGLSSIFILGLPCAKTHASCIEECHSSWIYLGIALGRLQLAFDQGAISQSTGVKSKNKQDLTLGALTSQTIFLSEDPSTPDHKELMIRSWGP